MICSVDLSTRNRPPSPLFSSSIEKDGMNGHIHIQDMNEYAISLKLRPLKMSVCIAKYEVSYELA